MSDVKSFILWYSSKSHAKVRFFVGVTKVKCLLHGFHEKPSWTYEKSEATILDGDQGAQAKLFAEQSGYTDLVLEPIDEQPALAKPVEEQVT